MVADQDAISRAIAQATEAVTAYGDRPRPGPAFARDVADALLNLRACFEMEDGRPDWVGRTQGYKDAYQAVFLGAKIDPDKAKRLQRSVRYHIDYLRAERLSEDELESYGLSATPQRDRAKQTQRVTRGVEVRDAAVADSSPTSSLGLLRAANSMLSMVYGADLDDTQRREAETWLRRLERAVEDIRHDLGEDDEVTEV